MRMSSLYSAVGYLCLFVIINIGRINADENETQCILPEQPENGRYYVKRSNISPVPGTPVALYTVLIYSCSSGYDGYDGYGVGPVRNVVCNENGTWSNSPICKKQCFIPKSNSAIFTCFDRGSHHISIPCGNRAPHGTYVKLSCKSGYTLIGNQTHITCDEHTDLENITICEEGRTPNCSSTPEGEISSCESSTVINETEQELNSPSTESSSEKYCILPPPPRIGNVVQGFNEAVIPGSRVRPHTFLKYTCPEGFDLIPKFPVFCQENGEWSTLPECLRQCRMPISHTVDFSCEDANRNEFVCGEYIPSGTTIRYECKNYHYSLFFFDYNLKCLDGVINNPTPRCVSECGVEPSEGVTFVVGGQTTKGGTFPWHTAVYVNMSKTAETNYEYQCGGSLITTHLVISAAHCFLTAFYAKRTVPGMYAVGVGKFTRNWNSPDDDAKPFVQKSEVKNVHFHRSYDGSERNHQGDIAIVELTTPVRLSDAVHPVCLNLNNDALNRQQLKPNSLGKVSGWGLTSEGGSPSDELQYLNVPVIDDGECAREMDKYNFKKFLTIDKICAGYKNGSSVCQGDSGGGLVFPHKEITENVKRWYLRGIVSVGPTNKLNEVEETCRKDTYTAYTQVHYFKDWLRAMFNELNV